MKSQYRKVREGVYEPVDSAPPQKVDTERIRQIVVRQLVVNTSELTDTEQQKEGPKEACHATKA